MRMMPVIILPVSCALVRLNDISAPKEEAVGNQGTDLEGINSVTIITRYAMRRCLLGLGTYSSIGHEHCVRKASGEPRNTIFCKSVLVEHATNKDLRGRVRSAIL
jgi:hypothetical protein